MKVNRLKLAGSLSSHLINVRLEINQGPHSKKDRASSAKLVSDYEAVDGSVKATASLFAPDDIEPLKKLAREVRDNFNDPKKTMLYSDPGEKVAWRMVPVAEFRKLEAEFNPLIETILMMAEKLANDWGSVMARARAFRNKNFNEADYKLSPWDWAKRWEGKLHRRIIPNVNGIHLHAAQDLMDELAAEMETEANAGFKNAIESVSGSLIKSLTALGLPEKERTKFHESIAQNPLDLAKALAQTLANLQLSIPQADSAITKTEQLIEEVQGNWESFKEDEKFREMKMREALLIADEFKSIEI